MKLDENLNKIFNLEPEQMGELEVQKPNLQKEDDFDLARDTLRNLIHKNEDVLTELVQIAKNSEHPRAFEVVGQLAKTQADIAKDLMGLHKQKKDIQGEDSPQNIRQQNNIVFAGSTSDLMKLISTQRAKTIE